MASKSIAPIEEFRNTLTKMEGQFKMALPPQISPDRFIRNAMTAIQKDPELLSADRTSLFAAIMDSASDGLLLDGKEAFLNVYGKKVKYSPMIYGILKKVRNSGELASITAEVVYKNDLFKYWLDNDGPHIDHQPAIFEDRGEKVGVYMIAKTRDEHVYIEVMNKDQVMKVKAKSRAQNSLMWTDFEEEGWKKTVLRRGSKRLPMSTDIEQIIKRDDDLYDLENNNPPKTKPSKSRLEEIIQAQPEASKDPQTDESAEVEAVEDDPI